MGQESLMVRAYVCVSAFLQNDWNCGVLSGAGASSGRAQCGTSPHSCRVPRGALPLIKKSTVGAAHKAWHGMTCGNSWW